MIPKVIVLIGLQSNHRVKATHYGSVIITLSLSFSIHDETAPSSYIMVRVLLDLLVIYYSAKHAIIAADLIIVDNLVLIKCNNALILVLIISAAVPTVLTLVVSVIHLVGLLNLSHSSLYESAFINVSVLVFDIGLAILAIL